MNVGDELPAKNMIEGQWYRMKSGSGGRFVAGKASPSGDVICFDDGDTDMQSSFFLRADVIVVVAKPK